MLKTLVINPAPELAGQLDLALCDSGIFETVLHTGYPYPTTSTLERLVRFHAPEVVFIAVNDLDEALRVAAQLDEILPGVPIVAFGDDCRPETPLKLMRSGIREFLEPPFTRDAILAAANTLEQYLSRHPLRVQSTNEIYSFLPAKPGAGTTTVATNTSVAASRYNEREVLLVDSDLHNGLVAFMLSLKPVHGVAEALEESRALDEAMWPQLVTEKDGLDILASTGAPVGYSVSSTDWDNVIRVARRLYQIILVDLPGHIEESSVELMRESKQIFLVLTPEVAVLHLARKKLEELSRLNLEDRVRLVLNRWSENSLIGRPQIEDMLEMPIRHSIDNEYHAIYRTQIAGKAIIRNSKLGVQIDNLARDILGLGDADDAGGRRSLSDYAARVKQWWHGRVARLRSEVPRMGDGSPRPNSTVVDQTASQAPSRRSPIPEVNPLSNEEVSKILAASRTFGDASESERQNLSAYLRALVLVLRYSGLRLQDVVTLSRERVVDNRLLVSNGNTAEPIWNQLPETVCEALDRCPKNDSYSFFLDRGGGSRKALQFWRSRLDELFELAEITDGSAIRFRDTYAIEMLEAGTPVETVSAYLGHKNPTATRRRYSRWIQCRRNNTTVVASGRHTLAPDQGQMATSTETGPDQSGTVGLTRLAEAVRTDPKGVID